MAEAKKFVQSLFGNEKSKESQVKIQDASDKKSQGNFKRANTNVGVMNKFILQFSRVEKAYRLVEEAFIIIARSETQKSLKDRMKRKCKMSDVEPILTFLGFGQKYFNDQEIKKSFDELPNSDKQISFQRVLIGVGLSYFAKLDKEKEAEKEKENSGTEIEYNVDIPAKEIIPQISEDNKEDDDDDNKSSEEDKRFKILGSGFEVVKKMFDTIDEDLSGEISLKEFEQSFTDICRDPEIVKQRMKELDYNNDQNISFREFIFGISSWCGFNDEMIVDENDNDLDKPNKQ